MNVTSLGSGVRACSQLSWAHSPEVQSYPHHPAEAGLAELESSGPRSSSSSECAAPGARIGLPSVTTPSTRSGRRAATPRARRPPQAVPHDAHPTLALDRDRLDPSLQGLRGLLGAADVGVHGRADRPVARLSELPRHQRQRAVTGHEPRHEHHRAEPRPLGSAGDRRGPARASLAAPVRADRRADARGRAVAEQDGVAAGPGGQGARRDRGAVPPRAGPGERRRDHRAAVRGARHRAVDGGDVPDLPAAPAGCLAGR